MFPILAGIIMFNPSFSARLDVLLNWFELFLREIDGALTNKRTDFTNTRGVFISKDCMGLYTVGVLWVHSGHYMANLGHNCPLGAELASLYHHLKETITIWLFNISHGKWPIYRWFTNVYHGLPIKNGGSFHGELLVITRAELVLFLPIQGFTSLDDWPEHK